MKRAGRFRVVKKLFSKLEFISSVKEIIRNIPRAAWVVSSVFGIFMFGLILGFMGGQDEANLKLRSATDEGKKNYIEVINAYEKIGDLYFQQGEDVSIMTNTNLWASDPQEVVEAIQSFKQKRDEIIFQQGVISEARRRAELTTGKEQL